MENCGVGEKVLNFYKELPFNYYGSIEGHVKSVIQQSPIEEIYPSLKGLVTSCKNILEIGCGTGWVTNSIANHYNKKINSQEKFCKSHRPLVKLHTSFHLVQI